MKLKVHQNKTRKVISFMTLSLVILISFQNCTEPSLTYNKPLNITDADIEGNFCYPIDASIETKYSMSNFYVINANATMFAGKLWIDNNANGFPDENEKNLPTKPETLQISAQDKDGDTILDFVESLKQLNPESHDANDDSADNDGITNIDEIKQGTDPNFPDTKARIEQTSSEVDEASDSHCGEGQPYYEFRVKNVPILEAKGFEDPINVGDVSFTHSQDENVIMFIVHLIPLSQAYPEKFLIKVVRKSLYGSKEFTLDPSDFKEL